LCPYYRLEVTYRWYNDHVIKLLHVRQNHETQGRVMQCSKFLFVKC